MYCYHMFSKVVFLFIAHHIVAPRKIRDEASDDQEKRSDDADDGEHARV